MFDRLIGVGQGKVQPTSRIGLDRVRRRVFGIHGHGQSTRKADEDVRPQRAGPHPGFRPQDTRLLGADGPSAVFAAQYLGQHRVKGGFACLRHGCRSGIRVLRGLPEPSTGSLGKSDRTLCGRTRTRR